MDASTTGDINTYLGTRNRPKRREFFAEFLIIYGVVQVLDVQINALKQCHSVIEEQQGTEVSHG